MTEFGRPELTALSVTGRSNLITKHISCRCKAQVLHGLTYNCNVGLWVKEATLNEH